MKRYAFADSRVGKVLFGIFMFALLMLSRNTLVSTSILGFNLSQYLLLGTVGIAGLAFLAVNRKQLKQILLDYKAKYPEKVGHFGEMDLAAIVKEMTAE